jgi:DinB superfamily
MDLRYPIGEFKCDTQPSAAEITQFISDIEEVPARLRAALAGLSEQQLETPYRPGGWTVRQVAHHLSESHMNGYVRVKLALTEDNPTIKPYDEARWAETPDVRDTPIAASLTLLEALHQRWVILLKALGPSDFARAFTHPESGLWTIGRYVALYSWHGKHHVAHITSLRERMGW